MSLVEQTIARLKKNQGQDNKPQPPSGRSPHGGAPVPERLEETANLGKQVAIDNTMLRARGYFPDQAMDRQFADQYRRIKRALVEKALSSPNPNSAVRGPAGPRVIMVTSALPGDGKTFTTVNLALSMALERDISVLLIDADAPKRHVSEILGLGQEQGLLDLLVDESLDPEQMIVPTTIKGLSVLPAGRRVAGTAELLSSSRMGSIIAALCARNPRRVLLLDSPPLLITNEGQALVKMAGQVVLVIRAGETPRQAVQSAIALIDPQQSGGIVLNQVWGKSQDDYYGYGAYGTESEKPT